MSETSMVKTPDQIMIGVVATLAERLGPGGGVEPDGLENLTRAITEAIYSAMAAEREACASIAGRWPDLLRGIKRTASQTEKRYSLEDMANTYESIAADIRARGAK